MKKSKKKKKLSLKATYKRTPRGWRSLVEEGYQVCTASKLDFKIFSVLGRLGDLQFCVELDGDAQRQKIVRRYLMNLEVRSLEICQECGGWGKLSASKSRILRPLCTLHQ